MLTFVRCLKGWW